MERGYLIAALAMIVTFAGVSRGLRSLEQLPFVKIRHFAAVAMAKPRCEANSSHAAARTKARRRPGGVDEAQLLAEMNVPLSEMQSTIAEQMGRQDAAIARCAHDRALREAERARRDAMRMQADTERAYEHGRVDPLSLEIYLPPNFQQRTAAAAARLAASNLRLQNLADQISATEIDLPSIDVRVADDMLPQVRCKVKTVRGH